jgi:hypothetical protein
LDGSELAESALKETLILARALAAEVIFLQVVPAAEDVIRHGATTITIDEQWQARNLRAAVKGPNKCSMNKIAISWPIT